MDQRKVRYVFPGDVEARGQLSDDKEDGEGDSISDILIQKERIRSIITPGCDKQSEKEAQEKAEGHQHLAQNEYGRSPYSGAQLKAVSINHKNVKQDPVFPKGAEFANANLSSEKPCVKNSDNQKSNAVESNPDASAPDKSVGNDNKLQNEETPGNDDQFKNGSSKFNFDKQLANAKEERLAKQENQQKKDNTDKIKSGESQSIQKADEPENKSPADKSDVSGSKRVGNRRSSWTFEPILKVSKNDPSQAAPMIKVDALQTPQDKEG